MSSRTNTTTLASIRAQVTTGRFDSVEGPSSHSGITMTILNPLTVLSGRPQHVAATFVVGVAAGDEQIIRKPVDVFERRRRNLFACGILEFDHDALGAAADGAGKMQVGGRGAAAGQDEGLQRLKLAVEPVDLSLEPGDLHIGNGEAGAAGPFFGKAEVGLDVEQVVLDARQRGIERLVGAGVQAHQPKDRVDLIYRAVSLDAQVVFLAPRARAERGGAVVAGAGIDAVEHNHGRKAFCVSPNRARLILSGFDQKQGGTTYAPCND